MATRLLPIDIKWLFPDTVAVVEILLTALVNLARVDLQNSENETFHVFSQIPGGTITGIRSLQYGCLYQRTGLQILHSSVSNDDSMRNFAILGTGLDTDKHYGDQNRLAKRNLLSYYTHRLSRKTENVVKQLWDNLEKPTMLYSLTLDRQSEPSWT